MTAKSIDERVRLVSDRIDSLARISEDRDYLSRTFLTPACKQANDLVLSWAKASGLHGWEDNIGNVRIRLCSHDSTKNTLLIGSHLDTVVNAGKFDGILGFLIGLDLLENFHAVQTSIGCNLELVGFANEEGARFPLEYAGSRVVAGSFNTDLLQETDKQGVSLYTAIEQFGGNPDRLQHDGIARDQLLAYFEVHIEQGPRLEEWNSPVGVVSGIAGKKRAELTFSGKAGHAGTVPMHLRHDALAAAAEFIVGAENIGRQHGDSLVVTVGQLRVAPGASNVIPAETVLSLDLRSLDPGLLDKTYASLQILANDIARRRQIDLTCKLIQNNLPVACDQALQEVLAASIKASAVSPVTLTSGAGHDAVVMSEICPICMLFVRCKDGISHHPSENVKYGDIHAAIAVSEHFVNRISMPK